jgi:hypothetical protein
MDFFPIRDTPERTPAIKKTENLLTKWLICAFPSLPHLFFDAQGWTSLVAAGCSDPQDALLIETKFVFCCQTPRASGASSDPSQAEGHEIPVAMPTYRD